MTVYRVTCEPWEHGLVLHIDGVGVTQTHDDHPDDTAEAMARSYIALALGVEPDSFDLLVTPPETTAAIQAGYAEAERGETRDLGSFEQYLDDDARVEMRAELAATPPDQQPAVLAAWKSTAEVYADPELLAALTRDAGNDADPIELEPTTEQRARWEEAAAAQGKTLEAFLAAAADAAVEDLAYARAMRQRKRGSAED